MKEIIGKISFYESVKGIESCNIGGMRNIGQEDGKMITAQICFTPKDIENVKKIQDFGIEIDTRTDPADTKRKFNWIVTSGFEE